MAASLAAVAGGSFLIYAFALAGYFRPDARRRPATVVLAASGAISAAIHMVSVVRLPGLGAAHFAGTLSLYIAGLALFAGAVRALGAQRLSVAFARDTPRRLVEQGVYRRIRHPFYTAYLLTWLAGAVAAPSAWTAVTVIVMAVQYAAAARSEERKFAASPLAPAYARYRRHAGMFWPVLR